jgi:hypothetical protein
MMVEQQSVVWGELKVTSKPFKLHLLKDQREFLTEGNKIAINTPLGLHKHTNSIEINTVHSWCSLLDFLI